MSVLQRGMFQSVSNWMRICASYESVSILRASQRKHNLDETMKAPD